MWQEHDVFKENGDFRGLSEVIDEWGVAWSRDETSKRLPRTRAIWNPRMPHWAKTHEERMALHIYIVSCLNEIQWPTAMFIIFNEVSDRSFHVEEPVSMATGEAVSRLTAYSRQEVTRDILEAIRPDGLPNESWLPKSPTVQLPSVTIKGGKTIFCATAGEYLPPKFRRAALAHAPAAGLGGVVSGGE